MHIINYALLTNCVEVIFKKWKLFTLNLRENIYRDIPYEVNIFPLLQ